MSIPKNRYQFQSELDMKKCVDVLKIFILSVGLMWPVISTFAKTLPSDCGCSDTTLRPSKDRIRIVYSKEVLDQLAVARKTSPEVHERLQKLIANTDTLIQRHMNGDIYYGNDPDGWEEYNAPLMALSLDQWIMKRKGKADNESAPKAEHSYSNWLLCPSAKLMSFEMTSDVTVAKYQSSIVGRYKRYWSSKKNPPEYTFDEKGSVFYFEAFLNQQGKVINLKTEPVSEHSGPFTYEMRTLKRMTTEWGSAFGNPEQNTLRQKKAKQELEALLQAAKICRTQLTTGKER